LPEDAQLLDDVQASQWIAAGDSLLGAGQAEAALVLVWSALEATIRRLLEEEEPYLSLLDSAHILNLAVFHGILSRDDYNALMKVRKYRNAAVHGFETSDFDFAAGYSVIKSTIGHLLQSEVES
jgi:hypothetical protein